MRSLSSGYGRVVAQVCASAVVAGAVVEGAVAENILISEFFEEILSVDSETGAVVDLVDTPIGGTDPFGHHIERGSDGTIYVTGFGDLYTFSPGASNPYSYTKDFGVASFTSLTRDLNGKLIAISASSGDGVLRLDPETGDMSVVHEETFFTPSDAVVDAAGNIFVTEFFDGLGYIPASGGGFVQIGDFDPNEFDQIDIGVDGYLYVADTFGGFIDRVDPVTGQRSTVSSAMSRIDDFQISDDGTIYFVGAVGSGLDAVEGLYRLNGSLPDLMIGNDTIDFFNPQSLAVAATGFRATAIPEPASMMLIAMGSLGAMRRRRA